MTFYLPPATTVLPTVSEDILKALWSIRNLSKNSQRSYAKYLKRLYREVDMKDLFKVETFFLNAEWKNKTKSNFLMAYQPYCKAARTQSHV